jgi:adenine nucleotide transporter 17
VIATRQQLATRSVSFLSTFKSILAEDGLTGLWRGLKPSLVLTVNPAITYGMFERLKSLLLREGEPVGPGKAFALGAASKTLATVVTYPYIMAKTRLQAKYEEVEDAAGEEKKAGAERLKRKERYDGAIDCLRQVRREQGLLGWYQVSGHFTEVHSQSSPTRANPTPGSRQLQGMQAQIVKAVLSQALLFGIKDILEKCECSISHSRVALKS